MGRRKVEDQHITDERKRLKTFVDRKAGVFKKATQISVLCACKIAIRIESENGNVFEFGDNGAARVSTCPIPTDNDRDAKDESSSAQSSLEVVNSQIPRPFFKMEKDPNYIHDAVGPFSIDVGSYSPEMILPDDLPLQFPDINEWY